MENESKEHLYGEYLYILGRLMKITPEKYADKNIIVAMGSKLKNMSRCTRAMLIENIETLNEMYEKILISKQDRAEDN